MSDRTGIQWTDSTWNPIVGCSIVSPGCTNCYAMKMAHRLQAMGKQKYSGLTKVVNGKPVWTGVVRLDEAALDQPLHWRQPRRIFVNSMSDLFHEDVPDEWIDRVFATMALAPQHAFQVLTKRAKRMRDYMSKHDAALPSVWLGVSVEDQARADERIPILLDTPAAVRFVSVEPLLGPVDLRDVSTDGLAAAAGNKLADCLHWVIIGGESGPGARPFDLDWARQIIRQCKAAGVACFVKQVGSQPQQCGYPYYRGYGKGGDPSWWPEDLRVREYPA